MAFEGLLKSVELWHQLSFDSSVERENLFLDSIDNLHKFRGLELLRGKLLTSSPEELVQLATAARQQLIQALSVLEQHSHSGEMELQIAYSVLKSDVSSAIVEVGQFLENIKEE